MELKIALLLAAWFNFFLLLDLRRDWRSIGRGRRLFVSIVYPIAIVGGAMAYHKYKDPRAINAASWVIMGLALLVRGPFGRKAGVEERYDRE